MQLKVHPASATFEHECCPDVVQSFVLAMDLLEGTSEVGGLNFMAVDCVAWQPK